MITVIHSVSITGVIIKFCRAPIAEPSPPWCTTADLLRLCRFPFSIDFQGTYIRTRLAHLHEEREPGRKRVMRMALESIATKMIRRGIRASHVESGIRAEFITAGSIAPRQLVLAEVRPPNQ